MYVELHAASAFSFLEAASLPEALVERAAELGYPAVALLDRNGVHGAPRFHKAATAAGIRPIVGAEVTVDGQSAVRQSGGQRQPARTIGYRVCSRCQLACCQLPSPRPRRIPRGVPEPLPPADAHESPLAEGRGRADARRTRRAHRRARGARRPRGAARRPPRRGRPGGSRWSACSAGRTCYLELQRHFVRDEEADNQALLALASAFHVPVVATNGVRFAAPEDRPLFDVLTCIRHKTTLEAAGRRLALQRRALPEAARADGGAVSRHPGGGRRHRGAGRSAPVHDGRPRVPLPRLPGAGGRDDGVVPEEGDARSARASGIGRITIARGRRSRASWT